MTKFLNMNKIINGSVMIFALLFLSCGNQQKDDENTEIEDIVLTSSLAKQIFVLPTHCLEVEFPNKLGQVIASANDLKRPKELRPLFYGCFDWHSSVHGYWSIIKLMKQFPELDINGNIRAMLNAHITAENVAIEKAFFEDENNLNFERTYGWAWLFKLQQELHTWEDKDAKRWEAALKPLVELLVQRYKEYLPKLVYPIRAGQHDNTAFSLILSMDYAQTLDDASFKKVIENNSFRFFQTDSTCNLAYEPSGYDFLSPCLEEAHLMSKLMNKTDYLKWLNGFMPDLFNKNFNLNPAEVKDRSDGKLVHLDGLNYSRAASLIAISKIDKSLSHLKTIGNEHFNYSIPNLDQKDDYMGTHWLGTFALYALSNDDYSN